MTRKLGLAAFVLMHLAGVASAQDYPNRPITMIVPTSPAGTTDTLARIFGPAMSKILGQEIVIDNRPGAANVLGTQLIAEAKPDGYTIGIGAISGLVLAPLTHPDVSYDPVKDFVPIYYLANVDNLLVANGELGVKSVHDLVALAKKSTDKLNYSSGGAGTISHFAGAMFASYAGIADKSVHIPYQGGGNAAVAVASGEVQFEAGPLSSSLMGLTDAKKIVPLAITGETRSEALPDVPTFAEAGMPEYNAVAYFGIVAPAGTPPEIVAKLNNAATEAAKVSEVQESLAKQGIPRLDTTPEQFTARVEADLKSYRKLIDDGVVVLE